MRIAAMLLLVMTAACSSSDTNDNRTGTSGGETATQPIPDTSAAGQPSEPEAPDITCDNVRCMAGTHCEMVQVQCIRAPCPPMPQCVAD